MIGKKISFEYGTNLKKGEVLKEKRTIFGMRYLIVFDNTWVNFYGKNVTQKNTITWISKSKIV